MKERKITRTITINTVTVFGADFAEQSFKEISKNITGKIDLENDMFSVLRQFSSERFAAQKITNISTRTEKRAMTEEDFIKNSFEITDETKLNERTITRTIVSNKVTVFGADFSSMEFKNSVRYIGGRIDKWEDETEILKDCTTKDFVAREIVNIETTTKRRGMTEEDFISKSVIVTDENDDEE